MIAHLHGSVRLHTSAIAGDTNWIQFIHGNVHKKTVQWVLSCNPNTVYMASGKGAQKDCLFWFRASKNCVQQSLSNYSLLIFSSGWTRFILGVESCPKLPGRGHAFFPSRWSEVISGTESDAMLVWITTERESHKKWNKAPNEMSAWDSGLVSDSTQSSLCAEHMQTAVIRCFLLFKTRWNLMTRGFCHFLHW